MVLFPSQHTNPTTIGGELDEQRLILSLSQEQFAQSIAPYPPRKAASRNLKLLLESYLFLQLTATSIPIVIRSGIEYLSEGTMSERTFVNQIVKM